MPDLVLVALGDHPNLRDVLHAHLRPELLITFANDFRHGVGLLQSLRLHS